MELKEYLADVQHRINGFMQQAIASFDDDAPELKDAMYYALVLGGKRARPFLVYATAELFCQDKDRIDPVAAAIECVHAYSLVHDDMPEMDNDVLRRGKPTVHAKYSPATALLTGDALQTLAFELLSRPGICKDAAAQVRLVHILATRAGYSGMCGGQAIDLASENQHIPYERLKVLHRKKTGALLEAAVLMGAVAGGCTDENEIAALSAYAKAAGLAFQIWDDVLDVIGDSAVTGKPVGNDAEAGKSTYPALFGLEESKQRAFAARDEAIKALSGVKADTSLLQAFADFCVSRDH